MFKDLIRYCANLSICREELLFINHHKEKNDYIENLISACDRNLKILKDSTKTLGEKIDIFRHQADSIKNVEKKIYAEIQSIKKQINDIDEINKSLDVDVPDLSKANLWERTMIKLGWGYDNSVQYDENKKNMNQLESDLNGKLREYKIIQEELDAAEENYRNVKQECDGRGGDTNTINQRIESLKKELANLYVKEGNVCIYGNTPEYVRRDNIENGDYIKVILGEDNGNFEKVVFTYKREADKWVFYSSEMIDGSKYRLVQ